MIIASKDVNNHTEEITRLLSIEFEDTKPISNVPSNQNDIVSVYI